MLVSVVVSGQPDALWVVIVRMERTVVLNQRQHAGDNSSTHLLLFPIFYRSADHVQIQLRRDWPVKVTRRHRNLYNM